MGGCRLSTKSCLCLMIKIIKRRGKKLHIMISNDNREDINNEMNKGYFGQIYLTKCSKTSCIGFFFFLMMQWRKRGQLEIMIVEQHN